MEEDIQNTLISKFSSCISLYQQNSSKYFFHNKMCIDWFDYFSLLSEGKKNSSNLRCFLLHEIRKPIANTTILMTNASVYIFIKKQVYFLI